MSSLPDYSKRTPTFSEAIATALSTAAQELRVAMPARVTRVHGNQLVDVQPAFKAVNYADGSPTSLPQVCRCPVLAPIGQDYAVILPIAVGDTGLIVCADRSLDPWMAGAGAGTEVDPIEGHTHALTDAVFVPGMVPEQRQTSEPLNSDLVIRNGQTQIRLEKDGNVRLVNAAGHELVDLTLQTLDAVNSLTQILAQSQTITMLGPSPTLWAAAQAQLTQLQSQVATIKTSLSTLKGS